MAQDNMNPHERTWHESSHASLCLLGSYLREKGFFQPLETRLPRHQKMLKYTSVQKLEMLFISVLAGAKAVSHTNFTVRADPALYHAFGLPGCAEQSVIADTLDAMTEAGLSCPAGSDWRPFCASSARHVDTTSVKPSWSSMWTFPHSPRVATLRGPSAPTWAAAATCPDASWCGCRPPSIRKRSGKRCGLGVLSRVSPCSKPCWSRPSSGWDERATMPRRKPGGLAPKFVSTAPGAVTG
jgi:hypothetical protein